MLSARQSAIVGLLGGLLAGPVVAGDYCAIESIGWTAEGSNFEPAQTRVPGSAPRHVSSDRASVRWWPQAGRAELEWRVHTHYPFPTTRTYSEQIEPGDGRIDGRDGFRPTPGGTLPPARRMARMVDLWLRVPGLLRGHGDRVALGFGTWAVEVDERGRAVVVQRDAGDPPWPERPHRVTWHDWVEVDGLRLPGRMERRVGGELIRRETLSDWSIEFGDATECPEPSQSTRVEGAEWADGRVHWLLRRIAMGATSDTLMAEPVDLLEVGDGLFQVLGSSHHSLLVVGDGRIAVVDAPLYPERSRAILAAIEERWPEHRVSHLVLTHHHHDHSGGLITFARAGAEVIVGPGGGDYISEILEAHGQSDAGVVETAEAAAVEGLGRELRVVEVPNSHAAAMLAVHIPDADHVFTADLYSPGRDTHNPLWAEELYRALQWHGLTGVMISGGHGRGAEPFSALAEWVATNGATAD